MAAVHPHGDGAEDGTSRAWSLSLGVIVVAPVLLMLLALPTIGAGATTQNVAILAALQGGLLLLAASVTALLVGRRSPRARKAIPRITLIVALALAIASAIAMWAAQG